MGLERPAPPGFKAGSLPARGKAGVAPLDWAQAGDRLLSSRTRGARSGEGRPQGGWWGARTTACGSRFASHCTRDPLRVTNLFVPRCPRLSKGNNAKPAPRTAARGTRAQTGEALRQAGLGTSGLSRCQDGLQPPRLGRPVGKEVEGEYLQGCLPCREGPRGTRSRSSPAAPRVQHRAGQVGDLHGQLPRQ